MRYKSILVTGGAGFIGSHFVRHMLHSIPDIHIVVLDQLTYAGNLENLSAVHSDPRFSFVQGDICDFPVVREAMQGCDGIVHFAAETHVDRSIVNPKTFIRTNVEGTFTLLEVAREVGVQRFIQVSTDEVYGNAEDVTGKSRPSLETDTLKPLSPYAASKAAADRLAFSYWATFRLPVVITRCTNNYGPYQYPEKQLPLFIVNALAGRPLPVYKTGSNTRDWIYVDDHCKALKYLLCASSEQVIGEVFNIGTNEERSILDNAQAVLKMLGLPENLITFVPDRPGHVQRHAVNSQKLHQLSWQPTVSFTQGLTWTIKWYQDNRAWLDHVIMRRDAFLEYALTRTSENTPI